MKKLITALAIVLIGTLCFATLSTTYEPAQYNTNGSTTQFQIQWGFFSKSDLIVYHTDSDGVDTTLVEGAGAGKYTVYAPNSDYSNGATITTGTTYPSSEKITIERFVPYGQELSINGDFVPAKPLETELDKLAAQIQQIKDETGRTLTIPVTDDTGLTTEFVNAETRALLTMGFDSLGNVTVLSPVTSGTVYVDEDTLTMTTNLISIKADGVTSNEIADLTIYGTNIVSDEILTRHILNDNITTAKILDDSVTLVKLVDTSARTVLGNATGATATTEEVSLMDDGTFASATTNLLASATDIKTYVDANIYSSTDNYFESSALSIPTVIVGTNVEHQLGVTPSIFETILVCTNAVAGWAVGDEAKLSDSHVSLSTAMTTANATNVGFFHTSTYYIPDRDGGGDLDLNAVDGDNFNIKFRAWK